MIGDMMGDLVSEGFFYYGYQWATKNDVFGGKKVWLDGWTDPSNNNIPKLS